MLASVRKWVLVAAALIGLASPASGQHVQFQLYGQDQGLENLAVRGVAEDREGFLWTATEAGLYRYDGSAFHHVGGESGAPEDSTYGILSSSSGSLWVCSAKGSFHEENGRFRPISGENPHVDIDTRCRMAELDGGEIAEIVGAQLTSIAQRTNAQGRKEWRGVEFSSAHPGFPKQMAVNGIARTAGGLWLGCDAGLCLWRTGRLTAYGAEQGVPKDTYRDILVMRGGDIWARGRGHILRWTRGAERWRDVSAELGAQPVYGSYQTLAEDRQGRLLANFGEKIGRRDHSGWRFFRERDGMPGGDITRIYVDASGGVWLGIQGAGLTRWKGYGVWESYTRAEGLPSNDAWAMSSDGAGGLVAGSNKGVAHLPAGGKQFQRLPGTDQQHCPFFAVARTADGSEWFSCGPTLFREHANAPLQRYSLPSESLQLRPVGDTLWVSTHSGLFFLDAKRRDAKVEPFLPLGSAAADAIAVGRDGALWVSNANGIYRVDPARGTAIQLLNSSTVSNVFSLAVDHEGALWVSAGREGVYRVRIDGTRPKSIERFAKPVLHSLCVYEIFVDSRGWVWLGGDGGVDVHHDSQWSAFNAKSGLVSNDANDDSIYEDADGSMWIGTGGGISHLLAPQQALEPRQYSVDILSARIGGRDLPLVSPLEVPAGKGVVEIRVGSSTHEDQPFVRMKFASPGYLDNWTPLDDNLVRMSQSAPRHSLLEFQLFDSNGTPMSALKTIEIAISPPWWRSDWAFAMYGIALAGAVVLGWRLRTRQMLLKQRRLEEQVAMRTREIAEKNRALETVQRALEHKATHDGLTGLQNRGAFLETLEQEIARCRREHRALVASILDLDHFKRINDNYGHPVGDDVLAGVARCLREGLRDYDETGRYGGEEFVVLLPGLGPAEAQPRIEELRQAIASLVFRVEEADLQVTASFGYAALSPNDTVRSLMARADKALYRAKAAGRDRVCFGDS